MGSLRRRDERGLRGERPREWPWARSPPCGCLPGQITCDGRGFDRVSIEAYHQAAMNLPDVRYARTSDGAFVAFQVFGQGAQDLLFVPGFFSNLLANWDIPGIAQFLGRLAAFARVVAIDRRGMGLSDRPSAGVLPPLETQMEDLIAVLDAAHVRKAHLVGYEDGAELCALLAASAPDRVASLVVYAAEPRATRTDDYPFGLTQEAWDERAAHHAAVWTGGWGREAAREDLDYAAPSWASDDQQVARWGRYLALCASPGSALAVLPLWRDTDIRAVLPAIHVPTLVLARDGLPDELAAIARWTSERIAGSRLVMLPGRDLLLFAGDVDGLADEIEAFVTGARPGLAHRSVLTTILFTDIVGSTERQAILGDHGWAELTARHHALVRDQLRIYRGVEVDTAGDGFYATFDGPARAVRCALAISKAVHALDLQVRAGLHTGECELIDGKAGGLSVSIGARIARLSAPSQVLVSRTVKDLVAGSGLAFEDAGEHALKGVPGSWQLFAVAEPSAADPRPAALHSLVKAYAPSA